MTLKVQLGPPPVPGDYVIVAEGIAIVIKCHSVLCKRNFTLRICSRSWKQTGITELVPMTPAAPPGSLPDPDATQEASAWGLLNFYLRHFSCLGVLVLQPAPHPRQEAP